MCVVIEMCVKYPGGRTRNRGTDIIGPQPTVRSMVANGKHCAVVLFYGVCV
jgi:hypothetical protein